MAVPAIARKKNKQSQYEHSNVGNLILGRTTTAPITTNKKYRKVRFCP